MTKTSLSRLFTLTLLVVALAACAAPTPAPDVPASAAAATTGVSPGATAVSPTAAAPTATQAAPVTAPAAATPTGDAAPAVPSSLTYPIVDTGQTICYDAAGRAVACPAAGAAFFGQDAQYGGHAPRYTDNGDGTISDNVTGLMWAGSADGNGDGVIDVADKLGYAAALAGAESFRLAGYTDWRLPTIKELYSLIQFSGVDVSGVNATELTPFIDADYFDFAYGDVAAGERLIDAQFASSTRYGGAVMNGADAMFGVNFADGRIKGYPIEALPGQSSGKLFYVLYVRGAAYGENDFVDNGNGTIGDQASGLTWQQADSGAGMDWEAALAYCEGLELAGADDWRLPNAKELQSIVDYGRSPDATNSAAIDPLFHATPITNEAGRPDYAAYWSSTTHANQVNGRNAAYVNFGRAMGYMNGVWSDVHGAGAQRSDPKTGDPAAWPGGNGPQGDAVRIDNYVRCVRGGVSAGMATGSGE